MNIRYLKFKYKFDFLLSLFLLICGFPFFILLVLFLLIKQGKPIFFTHDRIGKNGRLFKFFKFRTMRVTNINQNNPYICNEGDTRLTSIGIFFRKYSLDEFPQLINIVKGEMSFVGPRPDVEGFADILLNDERKILELRPGITSQASLFYKNEEKILSQQDDPETYNRLVIWPHKVKMNLLYIKNYTLLTDIKIILKTTGYLCREIIFLFKKK